MKNFVLMFFFLWLVSMFFQIEDRNILFYVLKSMKLFEITRKLAN